MRPSDDLLEGNSPEALQNRRRLLDSASEMAARARRGRTQGKSLHQTFENKGVLQVLNPRQIHQLSRLIDPVALGSGLQQDVFLPYLYLFRPTLHDVALTDGQVLTWNAANARWQAATPAPTGDVGCRAYNSTNLTIANNTITALDLDSETFDTNAMHSTSSNKSRVTIPIAGIYVFQANIIWADPGAGVGIRRVTVRKNGTTQIASESSSVISNTTMNQHCAGVYKFALNDYIEITVLQTQGASLDIVRQAEDSPELAAVLIR